MSDAAKIRARLAEIAVTMGKLDDERRALKAELGAIAIPFKIGDRIRERPSSYWTSSYRAQKVRTFDVVAFRDEKELTALSVRKDGSHGVKRSLYCYGDWAEKYEKVVR